MPENEIVALWLQSEHFLRGCGLQRRGVSSVKARHRNKMGSKSHAILISNPFSFMKHQETKLSMFPEGARKG